MPPEIIDKRNIIQYLEKTTIIYIYIYIYIYIFMKTIKLFRFKSKFDNFYDNVSVYLKTFFRSTKQKNGKITDEIRYFRKLTYLIENKNIEK